MPEPQANSRWLFSTEGRIAVMRALDERFAARQVPEVSPEEEEAWSARQLNRGEKLLVALIEGGHTLVLSNEIITETVKVLRYPSSAPLRDPDDLDVLQTAEHGETAVLCTNDRDFHDPAIIEYCAARGIEVWDEEALLAQMVGT